MAEPEKEPDALRTNVNGTIFQIKLVCEKCSLPKLWAVLRKLKTIINQEIEIKYENILV